jgi:hypothetical protein
MDSSSQSYIGESELLLEYSKPDIYRKNAFRISGLSITSTTAEITRQTKLNEMKRKFGGTDEQKLSPFQLIPVPTHGEVNDALQKLKDPEKRLVDEFFWFWPHELEGCDKDEALLSLSKNDVNAAQKIWISYENQMSMSNVSMHNLAVLSHLLALDAEIGNDGELTIKEKLRRDMNWKDAFKRWKVLLTYEGFWSRLTDRVKQMNEARLKTGTVRRMKESLPVALLQINGMVALELAEKGKIEEAKRHLDLIKTSGFEYDAIEKALRRVADPIRQRIKVMCKSADDEGNANKKTAIVQARKILEQTSELLRIVDIVLPEDSVLRERIHDEVGLCSLNNTIAYQVETGDDKQALELTELIAKIVISQSAKSRVEKNHEIFKSNIEYHFENEICFFCKINPKDDKASIEVKMHGEVKREYDWSRGGNYVTWKYRTITVPRCSNCQALHKKKEGLGCIYSLITVILMVLLLDLGYESNAPFLNVLAFLIIIPSILLYSRQKKKLDVTDKSSYKDFSQIKELLKQGWSYGEKPPNVA